MKYLRLVGPLLLFLVLFTVLSSLSFLFLLHRPDGSPLSKSFQYPFYQWWLYAWYEADDPLTHRWLIYTGLPAFLIATAITGAAWYQSRRIRAPSLIRRPLWSLQRRAAFSPSAHPPESIRALSSDFGRARWTTLQELSRRFPGPVAPHGGIVVGEANDPRQDDGPFDPHNPSTWGRGGKARLLIDPLTSGSPHTIFVAGTNGFKTVCLVPTGCTWTSGAVFHDPSSELLSMLYDTRRRMGHRVHVISTEPVIERGGGAPPIIASAFNVLDWIDISSTSAESDVAAVVEWVCGSTPVRTSGSDRFFTGRAKSLVRCVLADLLWNPSCDPELKSLETLRDLLAVPQNTLLKALEKIHDSSRSRLARTLAGTFSSKEVPEDTFGSILQSVDELTAWLAIEANARAVSGNSFRAADLAHGRTDIFLSLPLKVLQASPQLARCVVGALLGALNEAGSKVRSNVLFVIDEAARLGYLSSLKIARDAGRKNGICLMMVYQNQHQIIDQWGPTGVAEWFGNARWRSYAAITDNETQRAISEACGSYGVLSWSESRRRGGGFGAQRQSGTNVSYTERGRRLILPEEITTLRTDAQIIVGAPGEYPAILGRPIYFRRPEIVAQVGANPFAKRPVAEVSFVPEI